ncbi:MAG: hypothetical protein ACRCSF_01795, partial [Mycobacteriaceae bacterium]
LLWWSMAGIWFSVAALALVGAIALLWLDKRRRSSRGKSRRSWAKSHGFEYASSSLELPLLWKRAPLSAAGSVPAINIASGELHGEPLFIFDLEETGTIVALHRRLSSEVVIDLRLSSMPIPKDSDVALLGAMGPRIVHSTDLEVARRVCDRRMVSFAKVAPSYLHILWNEDDWTLAMLPLSSISSHWDEAIRAVRHFADLLRVLPPVEAHADLTQEDHQHEPRHPLVRMRQPSVDDLSEPAPEPKQSRRFSPAEQPTVQLRVPHQEDNLVHDQAQLWPRPSFFPEDAPGKDQ